MGVFKQKVNADALRKKLTEVLGREVEIFVGNGLYKVWITGFGSRKEVDEYILLLKRNGFNEMWVITL